MNSSTVPTSQPVKAEVVDSSNITLPQSVLECIETPNPPLTNLVSDIVNGSNVTVSQPMPEAVDLQIVPKIVDTKTVPEVSGDLLLQSPQLVSDINALNASLSQSFVEVDDALNMLVPQTLTEVVDAINVPSLQPESELVDTIHEQELPDPKSDLSGTEVINNLNVPTFQSISDVVNIVMIPSFQAGAEDTLNLKLVSEPTSPLNGSSVQSIKSDATIITALSNQHIKSELDNNLPIIPTQPLSPKNHDTSHVPPEIIDDSDIPSSRLVPEKADSLVTPCLQSIEIPELLNVPSTEAVDSEVSRVVETLIVPSWGNGLKSTPKYRKANFDPIFDDAEDDDDTRTKLDTSLVEHTSVMRGAIPVLPIALAYFCLMCNVLVPGLGTIFSGMFCLCFGIPRFGVHDGAKHRIGSLLINLLVGCGQLFTVLFCLVGWGWSVWWGVIMVKIARKYRKLRADAMADEAEAPPVTANNHTRA